MAMQRNTVLMWLTIPYRPNEAALRMRNDDNRRHFLDLSRTYERTANAIDRCDDVTAALGGAVATGNSARHVKCLGRHGPSRNTIPMAFPQLALASRGDQVPARPLARSFGGLDCRKVGRHPSRYLR